MKSTQIPKELPNKHYKCIWMKTGVVRRKYCKINYSCQECHFDRVMRRVARDNKMFNQKGAILPGGKRGKIVLWKEKLKLLPVAKRPCIHHLKGRIEFRVCTNEYRCGNCDFDQYFQDQYSVHVVVSPVDVIETKGFRIPQGYYFHRGHTWLKIEENSFVRVGIDDFALRLMGPLDKIDAPLMGKKIKKDGKDISVFRGRQNATLLSPISGVVTSVNTRLRERGSIANDDPYTQGWVIRVQPERLREDLKGLMINKETSDFMEEQVEQLYKMIEEVEGPLSADGGYLGNDIFGSIPRLEWEKLTSFFLHP